MSFLSEHKIMVFLFVIFSLLVLIIAINALIIKYSGTPVAAPEIPRDEISIGESSEKIKYLILGDSTSVSQGGEYEEGYAVQTTEKLAEKYQITYQNFGVSGARISDVLYDQLSRSEKFIPDVVLIGVGANDVTHLTNLNKVEQQMKEIVVKLRERNPDVAIVLTGSPEMGSVPRFPQPTRWLAGLRTQQINDVFIKISSSENVTFAYLAEKTGEIFAKNHQYFAEDNFHPNTEGYREWTKVLNDAISLSLQ